MYEPGDEDCLRSGHFDTMLDGYALQAEGLVIAEWPTAQRMDEPTILKDITSPEYGWPPPQNLLRTLVALQPFDSRSQQPRIGWP
jgi:hypothetical protein